MAIVFSLISKESFQKSLEWLSEARKEIHPNTPIVLIGNKSDLVDVRELDERTIQDYAKKEQIDYIETSAKIGKGVQELFEHKLLPELIKYK